MLAWYVGKKISVAVMDTDKMRNHFFSAINTVYIGLYMSIYTLIFSTKWNKDKDYDKLYRIV